MSPLPTARHGGEPRPAFDRGHGGSVRHHSEQADEDEIAPIGRRADASSDQPNGRRQHCQQQPASTALPQVTSRRHAEQPAPARPRQTKADVRNGRAPRDADDAERADEQQAHQQVGDTFRQGHPRKERIRPMP